jgi:hypothetical protein
VGAKSFLVVIAKSDEKKQPGEERNDDDPHRGSRQQFEMKMLWAKEPGCAPAEEASTNRALLGYVDLGHY